MGAGHPLRDGIHACRADRSVLHPVMGIESGVIPNPTRAWRSDTATEGTRSDAAAWQVFNKKFEGKCQEASAIYGSHMGMRMKMEASILSRYAPRSRPSLGLCGAVGEPRLTPFGSVSVVQAPASARGAQIELRGT